MMTPGETSARGTILRIDHPIGGKRYAAHVFDLPGGGIAWADSGWSTPGFAGHPFHVEAGEVSTVIGLPGWLLVSTEGDIPIEPAPGEPDGDRELARQMIERVLGVLM